MHSVLMARHVKWCEFISYLVQISLTSQFLEVDKMEQKENNKIGTALLSPYLISLVQINL